MERLNPAENDRRILSIVFSLTFCYLIVEIIVGIFTNSLALIADSVHMFTDAGALALAAFASWIAEKPATPEKTYGYYRVEILAALVNSLLLTIGVVYIIYEAYQRIQNPGQVVGLPMMATAVVGLFINLVGLRLLHPRSQENINIKGAFYEVTKDALGSVGVIVAGAVILTTDFKLIDPIVSILIAILILPRSWKLMSDAVNVLLESSPANVSIGSIRKVIEALKGVDAVHDLHVWTITSDIVAMSGHIVLDEGVDCNRSQDILSEVKILLKDTFDIEHSTVQFEFTNLKAGEPNL
jgi:cobalt-zinc-cadmium efflux system protein